MQLEDEELGLGGVDASDEPSPRPKTSITRSPSPELESGDALHAKDLAKDLAGIKLDVAGRSLEEQLEQSDEEELVSTRAKGKKNKRRKVAQPMALDPDSDDSDFSGLGIARKGRKAKAKGRSGVATPLEPESDQDFASSPAAEPAEDVEPVEAALLQPKGKKGRRAKNKGKDGLSNGGSGAQTPTGEGQTPASGPEAATKMSGNGVPEEEMSKRDRRKLREAAKLAEGPEELVSASLERVSGFGKS